MSLRTRLVLALLALALLPTAAFTAFTLVQLDRATRQRFLPGVDQALQGALEVSKAAVLKLEAEAIAHAGEWAGSLPAEPDADWSARQSLALRAAGFDFVQVYEAAPGGGWRLAAQVVPPEVLEAAPLDLARELPAALDSGGVIRSGQGALAAVQRAGAGRALLAGLRVPPDFYANVGRVTEARTHYGRLGAFLEVQRLSTYVLVGTLVVVVGLLAWALAALLAGQMTRPLRELSDAFERLAAGDLGVRVTPSGARELAVLGAAFNTMADRLAAAREAARRAEREAAWREVARRIAHELRNPLTAMRYALHRVQRRVDRVAENDRDAVSHSLGAMLQELESLSAMADAFAQYARMPEPRLEPVDLAEVAEAAARLHEPEAVRLERAAAPVPVRGDRLLLSRALHNLVINAREASRDGAPVEIRVTAANGRAVVEVLDRGAGLPEGPSDRLFDPYVSTKNRGSGLGLSMVRDVARQHGGEVRLEPREGGGARARLELPLDESPPGDRA